MDRITLWLPRQLADERADLADLVRIEADGRLVQDDHVGVVDDGLSDADALLVALGQRADEPLADIDQAAALLGVGQRFAAGCSRGTRCRRAASRRYSSTVNSL